MGVRLNGALYNSVDMIPLLPLELWLVYWHKPFSSNSLIEESLMRLDGKVLVARSLLLEARKFGLYTIDSNGIAR